MRLWHKDLITVLPKQQLLGQWRECCCIARNIAVNGTPNHRLVNKIMDYPLDHFYQYTMIVARELTKRQYNVNWFSFSNHIDTSKLRTLSVDIEIDSNGNRKETVCGTVYDELFAGWHNDRYLLQCYHNLEEKYDCGGISKDEWCIVKDKVHDYFMVKRGVKHG